MPWTHDWGFRSTHPQFLAISRFKISISCPPRSTSASVICTSLSNAFKNCLSRIRSTLRAVLTMPQSYSAIAWRKAVIHSQNASERFLLWKTGTETRPGELFTVMLHVQDSHDCADKGLGKRMRHYTSRPPRNGSGRSGSHNGVPSQSYGQRQKSSRDLSIRCGVWVPALASLGRR